MNKRQRKQDTQKTVLCPYCSQQVTLNFTFLVRVKPALKKIGDENMMNNDVCPNCKSTAETELLIKNEQEIYTVCSVCKSVRSKTWI